MTLRGGGGGGGLRTAFHTMKSSPQNSFVASHSQRIVRRKPLKELLRHLMPSDRYPFIPFLRTKSQMDQMKSQIV